MPAAGRCTPSHPPPSSRRTRLSPDRFESGQIHSRSGLDSPLDSPRRHTGSPRQGDLRRRERHRLLFTQSHGSSGCIARTRENQREVRDRVPRKHAGRGHDAQRRLADPPVETRAGTSADGGSGLKLGGVRGA